MANSRECLKRRPRLFAIYLEDLVESIDQLNLGVKVGKMLINIVLYAYDILLMAESRRFANTGEYNEGIWRKWQIKYNPSKTVLMAFGIPKKDKNKAIKVEFEKQQIKRNTKTDLKVHLYKTYYRPVLYYGAECLPLNTSETNTMHKVESNTIKGLVEVRRRKWSTWLLAALDWPSLKNGYYRNLIESKYTRKKIEQVIEQSENKGRDINKKSMVAEM
ncbi:hypothetical protein BpHYR1_037267, partial [Brachionus plicatilis]